MSSDQLPPLLTGADTDEELARRITEAVITGSFADVVRLVDSIQTDAYAEGRKDAAEDAPAPPAGAWAPIANAPKDGTPILGWCVHKADPYFLEDGRRLTLYGGHAEGMSHVADGPHVLVWGGAWDDSTWETPGGNMPDWWFLAGSDFEVAANPTHWMPVPPDPNLASGQKETK